MQAHDVAFFPGVAAAMRSVPEAGGEMAPLAGTTPRFEEQRRWAALAAETGDADFLRRLAAHDSAAVEAPVDGEGHGLAHVAAYFAHHRVLHALHAVQPQLLEQRGHDGLTPAHEAAMAPGARGADVLQTLWDLGAGGSFSAPGIARRAAERGNVVVLGPEAGPATLRRVSSVSSRRFQPFGRDRKR